MNEKMIKIKEKIKKILNKVSKKKKLYLSVGTLMMIIAVFAGLSYAWFFQKMDMATLMEIKGPADISILGPGAKEMASLDLNYTDADKVGDKVTIRRIICIQSEVQDFKLEIVHTTNLKGLEFTLYPATEADDGNATVTDEGLTYSYDMNNPVQGTYINKGNDESEYKYSVDYNGTENEKQNSKHNNNYETYDKVQAHAEPIYWLNNGNLSASEKITNDVSGKTNYRAYYVCEISWTETEKETDIFYILAKNILTSS